MTPQLAHQDPGAGETVAWFAATMGVAALVLFWRLGDLPIEIWDESRLAVNALEMARGGLSLVTTYDGAPDHWNTKPPLLIWLMVLSMRAFGANEWALRLPSVVSALATIAMIFVFFSARLRRPSAGFVAALVLLLEDAFVLFHASRSGNYDTMLALWTTGYLLAAFLYLESPRGEGRRWLLACALLVTLAFLTKTVQGWIFLPAVLGLAVARGRFGELARSPLALACCAGVPLVAAGYHVLREQLDPGYLAAVMANDLSGRYAGAMEGNAGGVGFYLASYPVLSICAILSFMYRPADEPAEHRRALVFLGVAALFYLLVVSFAGTKLYWYAVPLFPSAAIMIAIGATALGQGLATRWGLTGRAARGAVMAGCGVAIAGVLAVNLSRLGEIEAVVRADERELMNLFLRTPAVSRDAPRRFVVLQQGYGEDRRTTEYYVAPTLFYAGVLRATGRTVEIRRPADFSPAEGEAVAMCGASATSRNLAGFTLVPLLVDGGCGIFRVSGGRATD